MVWLPEPDRARTLALEASRWILPERRGMTIVKGRPLESFRPTWFAAAQSR
jgi:hypothetical protein